MVTVTISKVRAGSRLCRHSARRLNQAANQLLTAGGDMGIVFGLWSLAVEELGKALLLDDQIVGLPEEDSVAVQPGFDHRRSFRRGFDELAELNGTPLGRVLRVFTASDHPHDSIDPLSGARVSVIASTTGAFENTSDGSAGIQPSVDLRFSLLYVEWDGTAQEWTDNRLPHHYQGRSGMWELRPGDLAHAIATLGSQLGAA